MTAGLRRMLAMLLLPLAFNAAAHEGHEHEESAPLVATISPAADAPRLALSTAQFELVAVRDAAALLIYVDDFNSNAPLADLQLQVQSGSRAAQAEALEPGLYRVALAALNLDEQPGSAPLRFIVRSAQWESRVEGVLPATGVTDAHHGVIATHRRWLALLLVPAVVVLVVLRRRKSRSARP